MALTKIHLDTDLGGDIDDLCALALLLALPDVEIAGITTVADDQGRRAGYTKYALQIAGRSDIPVRAGADVSLGCYRDIPEYPDECRYWPEPIEPSPNPIEEALELLQSSVEQGATVVAIGPYTNLALLEQRWSGILTAIPLYLMGFHVNAAPGGFPDPGIEIDYNVQMDVASARRIVEVAAPVLIPTEMTLQTALRRAYLPALRQASALGALIVRQAEEFALDQRNEEQSGKRYAGLPDDTINFQHDPLACAVAFGWKGVTVETIPLRLVTEGDNLLRAMPSRDGKPTRVVTAVDGIGFSDWWFQMVSGAQGS